MSHTGHQVRKNEFSADAPSIASSERLDSLQGVSTDNPTYIILPGLNTMALIKTLILGNPGILDPDTRAESATYWAPPKAKSFTAEEIRSGYTELMGFDRHVRVYGPQWAVSYYTRSTEGIPLTGTPGSY